MSWSGFTSNSCTSGSRKKAAWLTLSPCAQPGFNPLPTGLLNQAQIAPLIRDRKRSISHSGSISVAGTSKEQAAQRHAGLVSHAAHREAGRRGTSVPIQIAVRCVIGVLVAPVVIAATQPKASAAMKATAAEVAAHLGMLTRKAATERRATTGEMASAEPAAHAGAAAEPAHVRAAAEPAHASAAEPAHVSATHVAPTEPAAHMSATPETPAVSTPTTV